MRAQCASQSYSLHSAFYSIRRARTLPAPQKTRNVSLRVKTLRQVAANCICNLPIRRATASPLFLASTAAFGSRAALSVTDDISQLKREGVDLVLNAFPVDIFVRCTPTFLRPSVHICFKCVFQSLVVVDLITDPLLERYFAVIRL